ncbi:MAG: TolC family protein [Nannocystaceae bacterium]
MANPKQDERVQLQASADLRQGLPAYLALALEGSPEVEAAFARWEASVFRISMARRLPEPTVSFGVFVRAVETRVGPQQARISLKQAFPWPSKLTAGSDAASARARVAQRQFEAQSLVVARRVADAYWVLWQIRRTREIHAQHLEVVRGLSQTVLARVSTGAATLADQQQVDLTAARIEDSIHGMDEREQAAEARLLAAVGLTDKRPLPTPEKLGHPAVPRETEAELASYVERHPGIVAFDAKARASESHARAEKAERLPSFTLGVDWIVTGTSGTPDVPDSGKDAVIVGAGIRLPLWQRNYADSVKAAKADARVARAEKRSATDNGLAELAAASADVRDAVRRVDLYSKTLLPQAESAYDSVLGAYTAGQGSVAQTLLLQRDLLELRIELQRAHADYARAWAWLEKVTGRELHRAHVEPGPTIDSVPNHPEKP